LSTGNCPRSKPKSWVLANLAFSTGVLVAMPILLVGLHYDLGFIKGIGIFLFAVCGITYVCMLAIRFVKTLSGKYRYIEERDWKDQTW
jgi:NO-binding membrane sensor protein with MHYT domain